MSESHVPRHITIKQSVKRNPKRVVLAAAVSLAFVSGAVSGSLAASPQPALHDTAHGTSVGLMPSFAHLIEAVRPAVVNISTDQKLTPQAEMKIPEFHFPPGSPFEGLFRRFFNEIPQGTPQLGPNTELRSVGSGFIIDPSGYIVTNSHVVKNAEEITVKTEDGTQYQAKLIGNDPTTDLALLKIKADRPLPSVSFGDSKASRTGDWVLAIGNPFGLGGTATVGIISARGRDIQSGPFDDYIQIDAPINRGNSGGPLFDAQGHVIGVNTAIYSPNGGSVGIGFAIPSSLAESVITQLREHGRVERGWLGVTIQSVTPDIAESLNLNKVTGALVADVVPNSPADKAGLRRGDVITSFDGQTVTRMKSLPWLVANAKAKKKVEIDVWRQGVPRTLKATIGLTPVEGKRTAVLADKEKSSADKLGLTLAELTPELRNRYQLPEDTVGVIIVGVQRNSPADKKGLRPGDVISMVGQKSVEHPQDVVRELQAANKADRKAILMLVKREGQDQFIAMKLA
jgi:serine protease Do